MAMRSTIGKGVSYALAPKLTFAARHPRKAVAVKAASWAMDRLPRRRRRHSTMQSTLTGVGAALVAVPIGIWLGRKFWSSEGSEESIGS